MSPARHSLRYTLLAFLAVQIGSAISHRFAPQLAVRRTPGAGPGDGVGAQGRDPMARTARSAQRVRGKAVAPVRLDTPVATRHGRHATSPADMPTRGWRDIVLRLKDVVSEKNVSLLAAGMAFYAFIAVPSIISTFIALYGLVFDVSDVQRQVEAASGVVPEEVIKLIADQLTLLTSRPTQALSIGLALSLALALWSSSATSTSLMAALNVVYGEDEKRSLLRFYGSALALTLASILFMTISLGLVAVVPALLHILPLGDYEKTIASAVRWPILLVMMVAALSVGYRFAPSRQEPRWRWVTWGAVAAALLWVLASALFSLYVGRVASYNKTYGSLAGVVVLLMWLYVSGYVVLLGATLNAELEHQTARDSTTGPERPMGLRGAYVADTLGEPR